MTDREKMLELLDEFKNSIVKMMDERDTLASESEELRAGRRDAEEKSWAAEEKIKELTNDLEKAKKGQNTAESKLEQLQEMRLNLQRQVRLIRFARNEMSSKKSLMKSVSSLIVFQSSIVRHLQRKKLCRKRWM